MSKVYMTKLFMNGGSQAVRIPAEFRFEESEVFLWNDPSTGVVSISSTKPNRMSAFFQLQKELLPSITSNEWDSLDKTLLEIRESANQYERTIDLSEVAK